jgi:hypothetical protein
MRWLGELDWNDWGFVAYIVILSVFLFVSSVRYQAPGIAYLLSGFLLLYGLSPILGKLALAQLRDWGWIDDE